MDIRCSTGTYIRTLCADIGDTLGCGACLSFLLRTRVGHFTLEDAYTLEELCRLVTGGKLEEALTAPDRALQHLPGTEVQPQAAAGVLHGRRLTERDLSGPLPVQPGQLVRLRYRDTLLAVAEVGASPNDGIVIAPIWVNKT
jgi:tRNA pseudouridine55 synthase